MQATTYNLFGFTLASDFPFGARMMHASGTPDLEFSCVDGPPDGTWFQNPPLYVSPYRTAGGLPASKLFRRGGCEVLHLPAIADFVLAASRITCHVTAGATGDVADSFLGPVTSYWLERRGLPVLHASAVEIDSAAVGFLAGSGGGKSSIAAGLMQRGRALLTDDLLVLERRPQGFFARPGQPRIRLWPDAAARFSSAWESLPRVDPEIDKRWLHAGSAGWGRSCSKTLPLGGLYVLEERVPAGAEPQITAIEGSRAVIELVRHSFVPHLVESVGLQPSRLDLFAEIVQQVPVRRLAVSAGWAGLERLEAAIIRDLEATRPLR